MKTRRTQFGVSICLLVVGLLLVVMAALLPRYFLSGYPFSFFVLWLAASSIWFREEWAFQVRLCFFCVALVGILAIHSALQNGGLTILTLIAYGVLWLLAMWLGTHTLLPYLDIGFGLVFSSKALERPTAEPERTRWLWKEVAYVGAVMRPFMVFLMFFLVSLACWLVRVPVGSEKIPSPEAPSVMLTGFAIPFLFLLGWFLFLKNGEIREMTAKAPPSKSNLTIISGLSMLIYGWGLAVQVYWDTSQVFAWTVTFLLLAIVVFGHWRIRLAARNVSAFHSTPLPKLKPVFLLIQILILGVLAVGYYDALANALMSSVP